MLFRRIRFIFLLLAAGTAAGVVQAQTHVYSVRKLVEDARAAVQQGQYDQAQDLLKRALAAHPQSPDVHLELGLLFTRTGDFRRAVTQFEIVLRIDRASLPGNLLLAASYLKLGEPRRAIPPAQRALRIDSSNQTAKLTLADALLEANRVAEAQIAFLELTQSDFENPEAWFGLAKSSLTVAQEANRGLDAEPRSPYFAASRVRRTQSAGEANRHYQALLQSHSEIPAIWECLGEYAFALGNFDQARACFLKTLDGAPWSVRSSFGLACIDLAEHRLDAALHRFNQTATINAVWLELRGRRLLPSLLLDSFAILNDRLVRAQEERLQPAARFIASVVREREGHLSPTDRFLGQVSTSINHISSVRSCLESYPQVRCWVESGFAEIAFPEALKQLSREQVASPELHYWQAIGFEQLGSMALDHLLTGASVSGRRLTLAAQIFVWLKRYPQAIELLNQALQLEPTNGGAWTALGKLQRYNVELEHAERSLLNGIQFHDTDAEAYFILGEIYAKRHEPGRALPFLERSLELHPPSDAIRVILAKVYGQLGERSKQIAQLLMIPPERRTPQVLYQLYQAYQGSGQTARAQEALANFKRSRSQREVSDSSIQE